MPTPWLASVVLGLTAGPIACGQPATRAPDLAIEHVSVVEVETGAVQPDRTVLVRADSIVAVGPADPLAARLGDRTTRIDGRGRFLIPGLWDMHVHAHRAGRAAWHYPLYLANGVTGVRDAGTYEDSASTWRARWPTDSTAPTVWLGSPPIDGVPKVLEFGLEVRTPSEAREAARRFHAQGFRFLKVYDHLDSASHDALLREARSLGIPVEGHVPLRLSPRAAVAAGQRAIDHLTLLLESCIPGALAWTAGDTEADSTTDSMQLLGDARLAAALDRYDALACADLFAVLAARNVWQIPTLVQMRGAFYLADSAFANDPRLALIPDSLRADWEAYRRETPRTVFAAGAAVFRRQLALVGELHRAGVPLLAGTDASDEPWVFPGSSLHDELALFVEAGLSPLDALRTATRNPARYRGESRPLIASGSRADLVLLTDNPLVDINNVRRIEAVVLRGRLAFDRRTP